MLASAGIQSEKSPWESGGLFALHDKGGNQHCLPRGPHPHTLTVNDHLYANDPCFTSQVQIQSVTHLHTPIPFVCLPPLPDSSFCKSDQGSRLPRPAGFSWAGDFQCWSGTVPGKPRQLSARVPLSLRRGRPVCSMLLSADSDPSLVSASLSQSTRWTKPMFGIVCLCVCNLSHMPDRESMLAEWKRKWMMA